MLTTHVIQNGNSQALCIPQQMRVDATKYCISKIDDIFIAYPADDPWLPVRKVIGTFSDDFMCERSQPSWDTESKREEF